MFCSAGAWGEGKCGDAQQVEHTKELLDVLLGVGDSGAGDNELRGTAVLPQADAP